MVQCKSSSLRWHELHRDPGTHRVFAVLRGGSCGTPEAGFLSRCAGTTGTIQRSTFPSSGLRRACSLTCACLRAIRTVLSILMEKMWCHTVSIHSWLCLRPKHASPIHSSHATPRRAHRSDGEASICGREPHGADGDQRPVPRGRRGGRCREVSEAGSSWNPVSRILAICLQAFAAARA